MAVPYYQSLMLPVLRLAATGIRRVPEVSDAIAGVDVPQFSSRPLVIC